MIAIQYEGTIKKFTALPKVWTDENGTHLNITDGASFGFYSVVTPTYNNATQSLGDIIWDADASVFTYPVIDKVWTQTLEEMKAAKIASLKSLYHAEYEKTDWYYIRLTATGEAVPQGVIDARANFKADCDAREAAINALTTQAEVAEYQLPSFM
jgi:hypothetical protein